MADTLATTRPAVVAPGMRFGFLLNLTLLFLLLLMWGVLSVTTESFATVGNISNVMRQASFWAIIAIGQTFVIITAGIDLSVGALVGLSGSVCAMALKAGYGIPLSMLLTLALGAVVGALNAFGIVKLRLPPFIMTLAMLTALKGVALLITGASTISGLPPAFGAFSRGSILGIPNLFAAVIVVAVPAYVLLSHTAWGRYLYAVGSNAEAARLSGVKIARVLTLAYVVCATLAAFVGVLVASRLGIGQPTTGEGWELQSIASSVIGGASLFGAVGTVPGPLLGALLLTTIRNGANLLNVNPYWESIITGGLIVAIVYFDQLRRRKG